jgi:hypothetical protein
VESSQKLAEDRSDTQARGHHRKSLSTTQGLVTGGS